MKTLLLVIAVNLSLYSSAQDWSLFPYKQKSYFNDDLQLMDSIVTNGAEDVLYFRKKLNLPAAGNCYASSVENYWYLNDLFFLDSLIQRNDTLFYYNYYSTTPFYFLPRANQGQGWTITSTYSGNDYNQITITCISNQLEQFLGITDSVKTYSLTPNGSSVNQDPISNFQIKLSKTYGLLAYVPFHLFLYHPSNFDFSESSLIGIDSLGVTHGYRQPKFHDYFHLAAGDILHWKNYIDNYMPMYPDITEYYLDSITQVFITNDSVVYHFDRTVLDNQNQVISQPGLSSAFSKAGFASIVETLPDWIGFGNNQFGAIFNDNPVMIWHSSKLNIALNGSDTTTLFSFSGGEFYVDTANCQVGQPVDVGFGFELDTKVGIKQSCTYNFGGQSCTTLIGYKINGEEEGSIQLSVNQLSNAQQALVLAYPNPSDDLIEFNFPIQEKELRYEIRDNSGSLVMTGENDNELISVRHLSQGIYFVKATTKREVYHGKFIKN